MGYDRQLGVVVLTGEGDESVIEGAMAISEAADCPSSIAFYPKHASGYVQKPLMDALRDAFRLLTCHSRVYIHGHGDWTHATCGGISGEAMADTFAELRMPKVKLISITSCKGGRGAYYNDNLIRSSAKSFAGRLLTRLWWHKIDTTVHARIYNVSIKNKDFAEQFPNSRLGEKTTRDDSKAANDLFKQAAGDDQHVHHRAKSKLVLECEWGLVFSRWYEYKAKTVPRVRGG
jgi:hypothetical protein